MASTEQTLVFITYFINVYIGYFIVITGLIGNIINIILFTQLKLFRRNQSAFYLIVASIVDCFQLIFAAATRATVVAFGFDPTRTSIVWCKLRIYFLQFGSITSSGTVCFAAIDQYLSTNYHHRLRQMSTFKLAQYLVGILIVLVALYSILFPVFFEIHGNAGCTTVNPIFNYYYSFVHFCILISILPIVISSLFSLLAYQNVRRIVRRQVAIIRRRLDRQLTAMILVRVILLVITVLPFVSLRVYQINNPMNQNDTFAVTVDQLIRIVITTVYNTNYSGTFYVFLVASIRFRRQVKHLFLKKTWRKCLSMMANRNQVAPENQLATIESHGSDGDIDS
ncbi:unnamed protein product [Rotaria sordida]|uniref:G-protein coupled receptors family 1 profile domain-containing protein n=1 Tax=Rotaria sordida TaxID=392033 RepID=A0A819FVX3_9BILA|nr:unnamed protein product [Rotaria sordida]CAF3872356.1 unnamed protein product [Rotaria sordida]